MPIVASVVIPAYNAQDCLERAVRSVQAQTLQSFEIIIIDDGSKDGTQALMRKLAKQDDRVRLLHNGVNRGVSATRNRGLAAARGRWVAILDGDDAYAPDRLERLVALGEEQDADMVADNLLYYDWVADHVVGPAIASHQGEKVRQVDAADFLNNCITGQSPFDYGQLKLMFRREFLMRHHLRYREDLRHGEDFMLYVEALLAGGNFILTPEAYYLFTQRVGSVSQTSSQMSRTVGHLDDMRVHSVGLLDHPAVQAEPALGRLLRRRVRAIRWFQSYERIYGFVRARNVKHVLLAAFKDWRVTPLVIQAVMRWSARSLASR